MADQSESTFIPYAMWTPDCSGKQDFDGPLLSVSTRYWPDRTAVCFIALRLGPVEQHDGGGDYLVWRRQDFAGGTETEVKHQVEMWAKAQMAYVVALLGGLAAFKDPRHG
ncbi:MAG: hypothetical protein RIR25_728 [Verrucomicrobiota bacterium]|jgi:hypothetical protein